MRKTQANVLLAAAVVVVGSIFVAAITTAGTGTSGVLIPSAYADANCDKANMERNDQGHVRGNPKQCSGQTNTEGEQPRSCHSPNHFKDNDEDGFAYCIDRTLLPTP